MFISKFLKTNEKISLSSTYRLHNGVQIPIIGFGTWQVKNGEEAYQAVLNALKAGYRHIDTAEGYYNEESVGQAIKDSGIPREDIFITTKLTNRHITYEGAKQAIEDSLKRLGVSYIDLYIIHWPNPTSCRPEYEKRNLAVYQAMEDAYLAGKFRAIGVSNFHPHHLEALMKHAKIRPMVNQILINPSDMQPALVAYNEAHDILTEAYSPFGTGKLFDVDKLKSLSNKYKKSTSQILLRWSLQHGYLPLPKTVTTSRMKENLEVFDFSLTLEDMQMIDALKGVAGSALNPDTCNF